VWVFTYNIYVPRLHRSIRKRIGKVRPAEVADRAEDYLYAVGKNRRYLNGITGLVTPVRIKSSVKRIDDLEKEILKMEDRIEKLAEKRAVEAVKLADDLDFNLELLADVLEPEEWEEFRV